MGDRRNDPADLLVSFLNTVDMELGTDRLDGLAGYRDWLGEQPELADTSATRGGLAQARRLRAALRALASGEPAPEPVRVRLDMTFGGREAALSAHDPCGRLAAAAAKLAIEGTLERVKICPADGCRVAFYDTSRNHSRQWCSMEVCGNRSKVRAHRVRAQ
ncbi:MAG: CGNR zinc finger domain-containing protein [Nocardioidaceae bacterium]